MDEKLKVAIKESMPRNLSPSEEQNQSIMKMAAKALERDDGPSWNRNEERMKNMKKRQKIAAAIIAGVLLAGGTVAVAATKILNPAEVVEEIQSGDADISKKGNSLADAFREENPEVAAAVNQTKESGGYQVTFLGMAAGNFLLDKMWDSEEVPDVKKLYAVVAIQNLEEPFTQENFYSRSISILIQGLDFMTCNSASTNASQISFVRDGILYSLYECDDVEMFADRDMKLSVVESFGCENRAFCMNKDGVYENNPQYEGLAVLFDLPIDKDRADPKKAEQWLASIRGEETGNNEGELFDWEEKRASFYPKWARPILTKYFQADMTGQNVDENVLSQRLESFLEKYTKPVKNSRKTLKPDCQGETSYEYVLPGEGVDGSGCTIPVGSMWEDVTMVQIAYCSDRTKKIYFYSWHLNKDKTVTYQTYATDPMAD